MYKHLHVLMIGLALVGSACTADDTGEIPVDEQESFATEPEVYNLDEEPYEPELTYTQCVAACNAGVDAITDFCYRIPIVTVRLSCLGMRHGGPVVCSNWCYWYFTSH